MKHPLPREVIRAWDLRPDSLEVLTSGHINRTYALVSEAGARLVIQRLNPSIFRPEVNEDLDAITAHLDARGVLTCRLVPDREGALWLDEGTFEGVEEGAAARASVEVAAEGMLVSRPGVWRALTFIDGVTLEATDSPARCAAAGRLLGAFHRALSDCSWELRHRRLGIHDTARHLDALRQALVAHRGHRAFAEVTPLAGEIFEAAEGVALPDALPTRLVHGDPKITNILFDPQSGEALTLIDLDTLARMPLALELGDALRSWCAPGGEESSDPIDVDRFRATVDAYAAHAHPAAWLEAREWRAIVPATELIALELAARFAADTLDERYFGWDRVRFPSSSAHNLRRARAQLTLGRSIARRRAALSEIVDRAWERSLRAYPS